MSEDKELILRLLRSARDSLEHHMPMWMECDIKKRLRLELAHVNAEISRRVGANVMPGWDHDVAEARHYLRRIAASEAWLNRDVVPGSAEDPATWEEGDAAP